MRNTRRTNTWLKFIISKHSDGHLRVAPSHSHGVGAARIHTSAGKGLCKSWSAVSRSTSAWLDRHRMYSVSRASIQTSIVHTGSTRTQWLLCALSSFGEYAVVLWDISDGAASAPVTPRGRFVLISAPGFWHGTSDDTHTALRFGNTWMPVWPLGLPE
jgi:hypothetical protein